MRKTLLTLLLLSTFGLPARYAQAQTGATSTGGALIQLIGNPGFENGSANPAPGR